ncbi:hypothetical protein FTUN_0595 [Frigoriglobus tundricola]|uniref:Uncharacterized protein n=1 Tax=Frigoriglobus tundricola TaxID=2774151 RepID=A0A6M5YJF2_9BACT|nr:hypothetical protein FTUN_0595 [Frigoriglobus tundricola]
MADTSRRVPADALQAPPRFRDASLDSILTSVRALLLQMTCDAWWLRLFNLREQLKQSLESGETGEQASMRYGRALAAIEGDHVAVLWFAREYCPAALVPFPLLPPQDLVHLDEKRCTASRCANAMVAVEGYVRSAYPAKTVAAPTSPNAWEPNSDTQVTSPATQQESPSGMAGGDSCGVEHKDQSPHGEGEPDGSTLVVAQTLSATAHALSAKTASVIERPANSLDAAPPCPIRISRAADQTLVEVRSGSVWHTVANLTQAMVESLFELVTAYPHGMTSNQIRDKVAVSDPAKALRDAVKRCSRLGSYLSLPGGARRGTTHRANCGIYRILDQPTQVDPRA